MARSKPQSADRTLLELAERQHGVVARRQLVEAGFGRGAIEHRLRRGHLHLLSRGVYAVGRRGVGREGRWMAAVLACGPGAILSHGSAAALWRIAAESGRIEVSVPFSSSNHPRPLRVHRRYGLRPDDRAEVRAIPVTTVIRTLVDLAAQRDDLEVERAVNAADRLQLVDPEALRDALGAYRGERGVARLRALLDRRTFRLTDSELEQRFLRLLRRSSLPLPETRQRVNGFLVDFYWPDIGLIVETDGIRYHRTPAQQARDQVRDQTHTAAGLTALRFTHAQVRHEPERVEAVLAATIRRLRQGGRASGAA